MNTKKMFKIGTKNRVGPVSGLFNQQLFLRLMEFSTVSSEKPVKHAIYTELINVKNLINQKSIL